MKITASATVQMSGLQFKGGPANLSSAVTAGTHTLTLVQTQMRLRMIHPSEKLLRNIVTVYKTKTVQIR